MGGVLIDAALGPQSILNNGSGRHPVHRGTIEIGGEGKDRALCRDLLQR